MAKISAKGIILKFGVTATPTDVVPGLRSIGINQGAREQIDVTTHDSTTTKEHVDSGLRETPDIEGVIVYDPANTVHEAIRAAHSAGTLCYATLVLPDAGAASWAASGHVTGFSIPSRAPGDPLEANFSFKANAADTFAA